MKYWILTEIEKDTNIVEDIITSSTKQVEQTIENYNKSLQPGEHPRKLIKFFRNKAEAMEHRGWKKCTKCGNYAGSYNMRENTTLCLECYKPLRVVILESDDWQGLYVDGFLEDEGHVLGNGDILYLLHKSMEYGFKPDDIHIAELHPEDDKWTKTSGYFREDLRDWKHYYFKYPDVTG